MSYRLGSRRDLLASSLRVQDRALIFFGHFETKVLEIATWKEDVVEEDDEQDGKSVKDI